MLITCINTDMVSVLVIAFISPPEFSNIQQGRWYSYALIHKQCLACIVSSYAVECVYIVFEIRVFQ